MIFGFYLNGNGKLLECFKQESLLIVFLKEYFSGSMESRFGGDENGSIKINQEVMVYSK